MEKKNEKSTTSLVATKVAKVAEGYTPFVSQGTVCLKDTEEKVPISILQDTGATQILILDNVLPFSHESSTGASVLLQGVELGTISVPLHTICLQSDFVSGSVMVGLQPSLPLKGISLILGNDLVGDKVVANLQVFEVPCKDPECKHEKQMEGLFSSCAVTRAMTRAASKMAEKGEQEEMTGHSDNIAASDCVETLPVEPQGTSLPAGTETTHI